MEPGLTVLNFDGIVLDEYAVTPAKHAGTTGGRFLLNGRPYYLRMNCWTRAVAQKHTWQHRAMTLRRDVQLAKGPCWVQRRPHPIRRSRIRDSCAGVIVSGCSSGVKWRTRTCSTITSVEGELPEVDGVGRDAIPARASWRGFHQRGRRSKPRVRAAVH